MNYPLASKALVASLFSTVSIGVWSQSGQNIQVPMNPAEAVSQKQVVKSDKHADRVMKKSLYKALAKHSEIDAGNISILAKNGVVTLNGTVTDADQIDIVESVVKSSPGVLAVTNKLRVQRPFEQ
ncbi:hyperosmotically inducible protein [Paraburkholderia sp. GAS41]|jgi:hyperosmotically inducible protein|uniref:BON domain-containing protein n=1 Tax=Paraburkholderia sp. GAS41 TaxID=3035134 RepID=UPI003D258D3D